MMAIFFLYMISVIDSLACILDIIFGCILLYFILACLLFMFTLDSYQKDEHNEALKALEWLKSKVKLIVLLLLIMMLIPSKNTMYMMMGTAYLQNATIPLQVKEIVSLKLDEVLKKLQDEKNK